MVIFLQELVYVPETNVIKNGINQSLNLYSLSISVKIYVKILRADRCIICIRHLKFYFVTCHAD